MTASPSQPRWCDLAARAPQSCFQETCPRRIKGAGNAGRSTRPAASRANEKKHTSKSPRITPLSSGIPRANGFNGLFRALLGEPGFVATIA
jgi:hypothetical protein